MTTLNRYMEENRSQLELFTTAITWAHGKNHPEAFDVRELYTTIDDKVKASTADKPEVTKEFEQLREVTNNYTIPEDVCETYAATYNMLAEADKAYQN